MILQFSKMNLSSCDYLIQKCADSLASGKVILAKARMTQASGKMVLMVEKDCFRQANVGQIFVGSCCSLSVKSLIHSIH